MIKATHGDPIERGVTKPVTKRPRVTKQHPWVKMALDLAAPGRPRKHATNAAKQKAYRERRKHV